MKQTEWFKEWFNTPYYHILYKDRNDKEAQLFIKNVVKLLKPHPTSHILDLACGKGRHSIYLNSLGYKVTGSDLSIKNIEYAKKFENDNLKFKIYDMREPLKNKYDGIFNLFTSFGYFDHDKVNISILQNIKNGLKENGTFVFDFLNVEKAKLILVKEENKTIDNINFNIKREIKNGVIIKNISFLSDGKLHYYKEKLKYLDLEKLKSYFKIADLNITNIYGNYNLEKYNSKTSSRLILIAK